LAAQRGNALLSPKIQALFVIHRKADDKNKPSKHEKTILYALPAITLAKAGLFSLVLIAQQPPNLTVRGEAKVGLIVHQHWANIWQIARIRRIAAL
jgi:hypothetical protein